MNINQINTPAILLDMDAMEKNLSIYCQEAEKHGKEIWPMVKTHKSTQLARLQAQYGCTGYLCGTLDEAESLADIGAKRIMYAYPVATDVSIARSIAISEKTEFIIRIDDLKSAELIETQAEKAGVKIAYTIIINSGLNRFGVEPENALEFADAMQKFKHLELKGISTHPGHVYGAKCKSEVQKYVDDECRSIAIAAKALREAGYTLEIVSSGSTPTFKAAVSDENIHIFHPGNYIFNDAIQLSTETASVDECALTVLASVISNPREGLFLIDAGAKCLGLDQGAHGNDSIKGYGIIKGYPELEIFSLSEEVGKIHVHGKTELKVGDKIQVIPNHSCSTANLTDYYVGIRGETVERLIPVDIRGNSTKKAFKQKSSF